MSSFRVDSTPQTLCAGELSSEWNTQGIYFPFGPLIIATGDVHDWEAPGARYHELMHFRHATGSTIGLLQACYAATVIAVHQNFVKAGRSLPLRMPFIDTLNDVTDGSDDELTLGSVLNLYYNRLLLSGYRADTDLEFFPAHIRRASAGFREGWIGLFGQPRVTLDQLDDNSWDSAERPPAPKYPVGNWYFGSLHVFEGLASTLQLGMSVPTGLRAGHPFLYSGMLRYSSNDQAVASLYRAAMYVLFDEWVMDEGRIPQIATHFIPVLAAIAELAVNPALLPCQLHLWKRAPRWTDLHPGYRFFDLCYCLSRLRSIEKVDPPLLHKTMTKFLNDACRYMGWPSYSDSLAAFVGAKRPLGDKLGSLLMTDHLKAAQAMARAKQDNLPAVLMLDNHRDKDFRGPFLQVRTPNPELSVGFVNDLGTPILALLLDEFYFSTSLKFTRYALRAVEADQQEYMYKLIQDTTAIDGIVEHLKDG